MEELLPLSNSQNRERITFQDDTNTNTQKYFVSPPDDIEPEATNHFRGKFTYAVCSLQLLTFAVLLFNSHLSAPGLLPRQRVSRVSLPDQRAGKTCWQEETNIWLGFRIEQLVHYGATYPPCIRRDPVIQKYIVQQQNTLDRASGCCIRRDRTICFQSVENDCKNPQFVWLNNAKKVSICTESTNITLWHKRLFASRIKENSDGVNEDDGPSLPTNPGPVCGLDPAYCLRPISWSTSDVTKWPVCERVSSLWKSGQTPSHMLCEVTARPCCIGILGRCRLTTASHCKVVKGQYHPTAAICSQVDCLRDVCGMRSFMYQLEPNQIYRTFTSLFIHAGFLQIFLSMVVQLTLVRFVEHQLGSLSIGIIYFLSGFMGNLTSLAFLPYHVGIGPMPAQAGILAIYITFGPRPIGLVGRLVRNDARWRTIKYFIPVGLLVVGFLPWLDNYANFGGFLSGLLLLYIFQLFKYLMHYCYPCTCCCVCTSVHELNGDSEDEALQSKTEDRQQHHEDDDEVRRQSMSTPRPVPRPQRLSEQFVSLRHTLTLWATNRLVSLGTICTTLWLVWLTALLLTYPRAFSVNCKWCSLFTCVPLVPGLCDAFQPNLNGTTACTTVIRGEEK